MTVRVALSGTGSIAATHARAFSSLPDVTLSAVVTTKTDGAPDFRARFGIPRAYAALAELLEDRAADALVICTPNALHAPQAIEALRGGLAVLVEKPIATNAEEAQAMRSASQQTGSLLMAAHCLRFHAGVGWLRDQVAAGRLGGIIRTQAGAVHDNWCPSGWFNLKSLSGGGALIDMGIHAIDLTRFLIGDPLPSSVYARVGTHYITGDVDDTAQLLVTWENGVTSSIIAGWQQPYAEQPGISIGLFGQEGYGELFPAGLKLLDPATQKVEVVLPGLTEEEQTEDEMFHRQAACFIDGIISGRASIPGGLEGQVALQIVDAAYQSSRTGNVVKW